MTDPATAVWLDRQQRDHNRSTFRWPEKRQPRRYKFTPEQLATAIRSLEKAEHFGNPQSS